MINFRQNSWVFWARRRVPGRHLLFQGLTKNTLKKIERCKRQATHVTILLQDGAFVPNKHRAFLMDTQVKYTIGLQSQERNLFLFNDLLLIAKERSSSHFKLKDQVILPLPLMHSNLGKGAENQNGNLRWHLP